MIFILYAFVLLLLVVSIRLKDVNQSNVFFSKSDSNILKGFSAMLVILHHIGQQFDVRSYDSLNINGNVGGIAVGIFFMLSAYGLIKAANSNEKYYRKVFLIKIPVLYVYQVLMNTVYYFLFYSTTDSQNGGGQYY